MVLVVLFCTRNKFYFIVITYYLLPKKYNESQNKTLSTKFVNELLMMTIIWTDLWELLLRI